MISIEKAIVLMTLAVTAFVVTMGEIQEREPKPKPYCTVEEVLGNINDCGSDDDLSDFFGGE